MQSKLQCTSLHTQHCGEDKVRDGLRVWGDTHSQQGRVCVDANPMCNVSVTSACSMSEGNKNNAMFKAHTHS